MLRTHRATSLVKHAAKRATTPFAPPATTPLRHLATNDNETKSFNYGSRISKVEESFFHSVQKVVVNVPATTANLGSGFDTFGFALDVWNRIVVEKADKFDMVIEGEGADRITPSENNLIVKVVRKAIEDVTGKPAPALRFECQNAVPPTRGMGSSSAALVGGIAAGLAMAGKDISTPANKKLLLQMAATEEGHADNVAPAIYGGFQIAFADRGHWITQRVNIPDGLQCVLFIPDSEMPTSEARNILPDMISREDAVFNLTRTAMLVNCFATSQFAPMRIAMEDRLHQQYRESMFPFAPIIKGALEAGAHGSYLSGAGPTVLAITGGVGIADVGSDTMSQFLAEQVSEAMVAAAAKHGVTGTAHIATPSFYGIQSHGYDAAGNELW